MALNEQIQEYVFAGGMDTKSDKKIVTLPKLLLLENADMSEPGAIKKAAGYAQIAPTVLSGITAPTRVDRLYELVGRGVVLADREVYEYSESADELALTSAQDGNGSSNVSLGVIGQPSSAVVEDPRWASRGSPKDADYARYGNYEVILLGQTPNYTAYWRDATTGALLFTTDLALAAGGTARVAATSASLLVVAVDGGWIKVWYMATAVLPTVIATATAATDVNATVQGFDLTYTSTYVYVAYRDTANALHVRELTAAGASNQSGQGGGAVPDKSIAIRRNSATGVLDVAWCDSTSGVFSTSFNSTLTYVGAATTVDAAVTDARALVLGKGSDTSRYTIFCEVNATTLNTIKWRELTSGSGATFTTWRNLYGFSIEHKPVERSTSNYIGLGRTDNTDAVFIETRFSAESSADTRAEPIATWRYTTADAYLGRPLVCGTYYDSTADALTWVGLERRGFFQVGTAPVSYQWDTVPVLARMAFYEGLGIQAHGALHVPGRALYAGGVVEDLGFPYAPLITSITQSTSGNLTQLGTYIYTAIYEYIDRAGNVHRSRPAVSASVTLTGVNDDTSVVVTTPFTRDAVQASIVLYRSEADLTVLHEIARSTFGYDAPQALTYTFADTKADTVIASNRILYTEGGQLENFPPPATDMFELHQSRLWCINRETGDVWPSKLLVDGDAVAWSPGLAIATDRKRQPPKCIASFGSAVAVFFDDAIGLIFGDGPDDTGGNGTFSELQMIVGSPVGCSNPRSIVATPIGLMFNDPSRGIHLLPTAGGAPQYIGAEVEDYRSETIVAATVLRDKEEVRFACASGTMLCYHYGVGQWSIRTYARAAKTITDAALWNGKHTVCWSDGRIDRVGTGYRDGTTYVPLRIKTPWLKLDGLDGFVRAWDAYMLGERKDACGLTVKFYWDYDETVFDTFTFTDAQLWLSGQKAWGPRLRMKHQTCRAFRLDIEDATDAAASTYQGYTLTGLRVKYGVKQRRAPAQAA